ncbi:MAG: metal ABC transporter permease [Chloroflexi bacterium]|nr:metal ABC transporter permease [Chloroflexota bacterium]
MNLLEFISLVFSDYTVRTVTMGAAVLGLVSGVLSTYAVLRKQSLLGDAMSHAAMPGVVLAFMLTGAKEPLPLLIGAGLAGWLGALLVMLVVTQTRIKADSALGIVLAVFFGFGLVLLTSLQSSGSAQQAGLNKFLFGQAAALVLDEVLLMAGLGGGALLLVALLWKEFKLLSFDPDYAATLGFPVRRLDIMLTTLIVVAIVIGLQTVGVVLMSAMLVAPAAAARQWTDKLGRMVLLSGAFGALAGIGGIFVSYDVENLPTGPAIVLCASALVAVSLLFAPNRGLVAGWWRARRSRQRLRAAAVLEALYVMGEHHGDALHPHTLRSLQTALPGKDVQRALGQLQGEGYVFHNADGQWGLTQAGAETVETLLRETARE